MQARTLLLLGLALGARVGQAGAAEAPLGLRLPPGFEVTEYADSRLADNIYTLTLDSQGRVVVSGPGYIRILVDESGQGRATRAIEFADGPREGAQGLFWEGPWLYFTADGGLRRYPVAEGGDKAAGPSELIRAMKTGGEHQAHAIRRGPDGWLYLLCGNTTGIDAHHATLPTSPIRDPVAGCVVRFRPDLKASEVVADGYRNPYGMDFAPDGELFTFDSDNERCVSLPWYEPIRFYHVIPGGHYGWRAPQRAETWRFPPYFADVVPPVATLGRGSPTGVVCYRHTQFPEEYQGGFFLLDWTFGRVYFASLRRAGASYTATTRLFLESVGDNGFAPTAAAVHPVTGDLFIAIGGRGTRGAVYRVRFPARAKAAAAPVRLQEQTHSLDWQPSLARQLPEAATGKDPLMRLRALIALRRHRARLPSESIRRAVLANWDSPDRSVRRATAGLIAGMEPAEVRALVAKATTARQFVTLGLGSYRTDPADVLTRARRLLAAKDVEAEARLACVRLMQLALGGLSSPRRKGTVWEGYSPFRDRLGTADGATDPGTRTAVSAALRQAFPSGHADLDREISRTLAVIEDDDAGVLLRVAQCLRPESDPVEDIHYLIVVARLRAPRPPAVTRAVASALLALDQKLADRHANRDRNWPLRLGEAYAELARKDPDLHGAVLADPAFGRPDHALFALAPGFDRRRAAERFLERSRTTEPFTWTPALVELMGSLPEEQSLPVLRSLWRKAGLDEAIVAILARRPQPADRAKFVEGLNSPQLATIRRCLAALEQLPLRSDGAEVLALIRCLRSLPEGREENQVRDRLAGFLGKLTGQDQLGADKHKWGDWFARTYPDLAPRLGNPDGVDVAGWRQRLARLDWSGGDPARGREVFTRATCASCHSGAQALGPDLRGAGGRFSRDDLFTAILQPSRDIAPRYRTTLVATESGKVYQGLVVYEAVDSLILQTGPAATVRIPVDQIASRRFTPVSMMPVGLLDKCSDRDIVDLYAYIKRGLAGPSLGK